MLILASLDTEALTKIRSYEWDRIIEKHEGPESWASVLDIYNPEFLRGQQAQVFSLRLCPTSGL